MQRLSARWLPAIRSSTAPVPHTNKGVNKLTTNLIAKIAVRTSAHGPITLSRLRRSIIGYIVIASLGLVMAMAAPPFWQAFGLGLILPGGGFLSAMTSGSTVIGFGAAIVLCWVLFAMGFLAWFGTGNIVAPISVWLGAALVAGFAAPATPWHDAAWLLIGVVAIGAIVWRWRQARTYALALIDRDRRNAALAQREVVLSGSTQAEVHELQDDTLGVLRHVLDRALQPVERFDGINWVDQFQFGSLRYALCGMGYALSVVQHGATPAFRGYLSDAQQRLHQKMLDHRNWKYWVLENAWGNLELDANPIHHRDNIMYHGWFMAMLAEYISNTGDHRYNSQPLVLRHPDGREWRYTFTQICEILYRSHKKSPFTLFPCEPNWIYPMCNNFSAIALKVHDRLYGSNWWSDIEPDYRRHFNNEFCTVDGRVLAIRSAHTGITLGVLTSAMADCVTAHFQHATMPDIARRSWEIARMDFIRKVNGSVDIITKGWDNMDTGSYKSSMITTYTQVGAAAAEMGDDEIQGLLRERIKREFTWKDDDGVATLENVSSQAHAITLCHFAAHQNVRRSMHERGIPREQLDGPLLLDAPYPDVLVTYAKNDGRALDVVLQPGRKASVGGAFDLTLGQLNPGARYRCEGALQTELLADARGQARISARLAGRTPLRIIPGN